jgi:hypothetical protein
LAWSTSFYYDYEKKVSERCRVKYPNPTRRQKRRGRRERVKVNKMPGAPSKGALGH